VRELARRGSNGGQLESAADVIAMSSPGADSWEPVAGERLGQAIAFSVGHSGVGQYLDQPTVIAIWTWQRNVSGLGYDQVEAEIAHRRMKSWRLRTGDEVESAMGHTRRVHPEVTQDLPECAGVRIDILVVGNDL
jgi:hypothetical protein